MQRSVAARDDGRRELFAVLGVSIDGLSNAATFAVPSKVGAGERRKGREIAQVRPALALPTLHDPHVREYDGRCDAAIGRAPSGPFICFPSAAIS
jgi:hypothetical protein